MKRYLPVIIALLLVNLSCDSSRVYESNYSFDDKLWNLDSIPTFEFEISDAQPKNVIINLRNTVSYPYQNIYLSYILSDSLDIELEKGMINLELFHEKTGKPYGKGNSIYEHQYKVLEGYNFPYSGQFKFRIAQYMREIELREVASVGIRVEAIN